MFNQSAGFQIYNSQLYNVGGDLNLRTQHHPTIQGHRAPGRSHTGFVLGIGASQQPLPIQDHEMRDVVLEPSGSADGRAGGFDHDFAGAARHTPHGSAARQALYDATLRPRSLGISNAPGPSLFNPRTFDVASHSGTFITAANVNFYGPKRRRGDMDDESLLTQREAKRRRQEEDGIKIIQSEDITLISEIGSGPGYFLHVGRNEGRATIIRVFNRSPTVRQQLESTVNLSKGLTHPNILRIKGISPRQSLMHFIAYENVYWKNAEGPLAAALKHDLNRSIALGFKMIAGFAAGMNYLSVQGLSLGSMGVENFDVFLDVDDRFLISINRRSPDASDESQESQENRSWHVFNGLCQKVLMSANRVIHVDCGQIFRHPEPLDSLRRDSTVESLVAAESSSVGCDPAKSTQEGDLPVQPRREYVWRTIDRGQQSLATVARQLTLDLDMNLSPLHRLTKLDRESPYVHRCAGYVREEITLATTTLDSAVVAHDAPSPLEICLICHEVVAFYEAFDCICGCYDPGSQPTIRCQVCKSWSHSDCAGNPQKKFTCNRCLGWETPRSDSDLPSLYTESAWSGPLGWEPRPEKPASPGLSESEFPTFNFDTDAVEYDAEVIPADLGAPPVMRGTPVDPARRAAWGWRGYSGRAAPDTHVEI